MGFRKASLLLSLFSRVLVSVAASELVWDGSEKPLVGESHEFDPDACPDYTHYAAYPQYVSSACSEHELTDVAVP
jgi:hypothetical protein